MVDVQNFNLVPNDEEEEFLVDFGEVNQITTTDFNNLENRPSYDNVTMTGDTNIPKVPSKTSELSNDSDYQTGTEVESAISAAIGAIDIPSKTSDLTNDGADGTSTYVEADDLAQVATTGNYNDLNNKPTIPAAQVNSDWNATSGVAEILNKPTIPTVNDATLTITQNGTSKGTFTANDADDTTIELTDTTYTAGNAISIDNNNAISAAIYPEDFFTANATVAGTGSEIALQKTIPVKLVNDELDGDTEQQTYSGKNLALIETETRSSNGITAVSNANTGVAILNNTATSTAAAALNNNYTIEIKSGKTYTLSANNPVANSGVALNLYAGGGVYPTSVALSTENAYITFTPSADYTCRVQWRVNSGISLNNFEIKAMVEESPSPTSFEPYVGGEPAPNPDYPQDIHVVTGEQTVKVRGKNLWGGKNFTAGSATGATINYYADGSMTATGTVTARAWSMTTSEAYNNGRMIQLEAGTYTFYVDGGLYAQLVGTRLDGTGEGALETISDGSSTATITLSEAKLVYPRVRVELGAINKTVHFMLVKGNDTIYQPYQSQSYTIDLGSTELCKIGDYQDYIYKSGGDWYLNQTIGKVMFNGTENWSLSSSYTNNTRFTCQDVIAKTPSPSPILTNYFTEGVGGSDTQNICVNGSSGKIMITISNSKATTQPGFTAWLSSNNIIAYYILATPTDTKITDAGLIAQLDALMDAKTYSDLTNIVVTATSTNLPAILGVTAYRNSLSGIIGSLGDMA